MIIHFFPGLIAILCFRYLANPPRVIVVGGEEVSTSHVTEILDLETLTWTVGPDLGVPLLNPAGVTTRNGTFYVVGGYDRAPGQFSTSMYEFDDVNQAWKLWPDVLKRGRSELVLFELGDEC